MKLPLPSRESHTHASLIGADRGDRLSGEWAVGCDVRSYQNGVLRGTARDKRKSLVVVESDSDGSYQLLKFPVGFGEGFPRLREVAENQYGGDDTVRGIAILVRQTVELDADRIRIKQVVIDAASKKPLAETNCAGARSQSLARFATTDNTPICAPNPRSTDFPNRKLARLYTSVKPFSDGLAAAARVTRGTRTQKWGFIDNTGRVVIPMRYDVVTSFHDGLAAVGRFHGRGKNVKWGVVEKLGPQVTPHLNYDSVKILGEGFAAVGYAVPGQSGLGWNLINRENTTIRHGLDDIGCFVGGRARAAYSDGDVVHVGYVDRVGDFHSDKK
ncbi:MAG TPA: WG repeat-containing protein [Blastocatellia bacterium]|nr:WG repeat-containing protein [Blastocatellia bacterium]